MNRYALSHMIRIQRVNRVRSPWLLGIGNDVEKLERVVLAAKALSWPFPQIEQQDELELALKEAEHLLEEE